MAFASALGRARIAATALNCSPKGAHRPVPSSPPPSHGTHQTKRKILTVKSELRTWNRKFREAAATGDKDAAADALKTASKKLDKAVSKGVIHQNQAANKKSAMAKKAASL